METCGKTVLLQVSICSFKLAAELAALSWRQHLCVCVCVCVLALFNALHLTSKFHKNYQDYIMNFKYPFCLLNIGPAAMGPVGPALAPMPVYNTF